MIWLLAALAAPVIEIAVLIALGDRIGFWPTIGWLAAAAALGVAVLRRAGAGPVRTLRGGADALPREMISATLLGLAGLLLVLPGVIGDAIGLALLAPPVRRAVAAALAKRVVVVTSARTGPAGAGSEPRVEPRGGPRGVVEDATVLEEHGPSDPEPDDPPRRFR